MKLSAVKLSESITPIWAFIKKYAAFIFVLTFLLLYVILVQRIGSLIQSEPSQAAIDSRLKPVGRLKVDEQAVKKINDLESQNIDVRALFDEARQNPFTE